MACVARDQRRDADLGFGAARGFLEADFEVVAQVRASIHIRATASAPEDVAEDVAERIGESAESTAVTRRRIYPAWPN
jgi:hypothetical protein